ncbi:hypothetical protein [Scytonema sp. PCC 10023]|uniref:hypothetical protein n=1 Tax=Scytonema sp. PCC 10023 TaxID=1680591 RepID=UPI0039C63940
MHYQQAKHLKPADFKRFWGVKRETFKQMVEIVRQNEGLETCSRGQKIVSSFCRFISPVKTAVPHYKLTGLESTLLTEKSPKL